MTEKGRRGEGGDQLRFGVLIQDLGLGHSQVFCTQYLVHLVATLDFWRPIENDLNNKIVWHFFYHIF